MVVQPDDRINDTLLKSGSKKEENWTKGQREALI
jgi:hypothetical protein